MGELLNLYVIKYCGGLTWAGLQVPSIATLSLSCSAEQGRENRTKGSWVEIRTGGITQQLLSQAKQTQLGENSLTCYQSNQSGIMINKT